MNRSEMAEISDLVRWLDEHHTNFSRVWNDTTARCPSCGDAVRANVEEIVNRMVPCVMCGDIMTAYRYRISRTERRNRALLIYSHGRGYPSADVWRGDIVENWREIRVAENRKAEFPVGITEPSFPVVQCTVNCVCNEAHTYYVDKPCAIVQFVKPLSLAVHVG